MTKVTMFLLIWLCLLTVKPISTGGRFAIIADTRLVPSGVTAAVRINFASDGIIR